jgi:peptidoglycan/LPS O-acetylase OafA/YrhL
MRLTVDQSRLTKTEEYAVLAPVSLLLGWCSLAVFVNIAAILKDSGMLGTTETSFSLFLLLVAGCVASVIIYKTKGNIWYTIPVIWGLIGVVIANTWQQPNTTVAGAATVAAIVLVGILVIVRKRDQGNSGRNGEYL